MKIKRYTLFSLLGSMALVSVTAAALVMTMMMLGRVDREIVPVGIIAAAVLIGVWLGCIVAMDRIDAYIEAIERKETKSPDR